MRKFWTFLCGVAVGASFAVLYHQTEIILNTPKPVFCDEPRIFDLSKSPSRIISSTNNDDTNAATSVFSASVSKTKVDNTYTRYRKDKEKNYITATSSLLTTNVSTDNEIPKHSSGNKCQLTRSLHQHQISLAMANFFSPPGSPSFQKMLRILQRSRYYKINPIGDIFEFNERNYAKMLEGYGLRSAPSNDTLMDPYTTLHLTRIAVKMNICQTMDCNTIPRILIQSEQMSGVGMDFVEELEECHNSPLCIILEFF
ncbi:hypothetical protein IV203_018596 [Nitzschia inconspicua]|uniref:Uncharacterized protein n=1 Tax=Nitzschia inconspicua TaxID=303405 RepID=A0A9K3M2C5_9STRA|nr:hypothetical protein IV203_018596 [Nitzschia inconspicua]